ncbi:hypothetical protein Tco_0905333, partial [Tanacetum coccineum]
TLGYVLGIIPKPDLLVLIFRRDVRETSGFDSFHIVSLVIGVLNPIIPLQRRLVIRVDLAKMLINALPDFWPKLGLDVGLQVKLVNGGDGGGFCGGGGGGEWRGDGGGFCGGGEWREVVVVVVFSIAGCYQKR